MTQRPVKRLQGRDDGGSLDYRGGNGDKEKKDSELSHTRKKGSRSISIALI